MKKLSNEELLVELEVPFSVDQVLWRVTNTANNRTRGQVVPYADPRAYTDRLNALVSPQGWTRSYETVTMNNITRAKRNAEIVTGKILVTCKVTIEGLGTHSGTGEEWADEDNAMTSAEAQAFKRACSCFGLGRYFYDFDAPWVDIDDKSRPKKAPTVPAWMVPENWRKGQRPSGKATTSSQPAALSTGASNGTSTSSHRNGNGSTPSSATSNKARQNGASNGSPKNGVKPEGTAAQSQNGSELDKRIAALQETVGAQALPLGAARIRPCQPAAPGAGRPAEEEDPRRAGVRNARAAPHGSCPRSRARATSQRPAGQAASSTPQ